MTFRLLASTLIRDNTLRRLPTPRAIGTSTGPKWQNVGGLADADGARSVPIVDFSDTRAALRSKTTWEIARGSLVLKLCSVPLFVTHSLSMMRFGQKVLGRRLFAAVMRPTFYGQFVAGESQAEIRKTVDRLQDAGVGTMLYLSLEADVGEETKVSEHVNIAGLSADDNADLTRLGPRLKKLGEMALKSNVKLLVDGEYSFMNPALDALTLAMMANFNKSQTMIWATYQCYLKKSYDNLVTDYELSQKIGFGFGAKIVRGAYIDQERDLAKQKGVPDPIYDSFEATSLAYQGALETMLGKISEVGPRCSIMVATHNENSINYALSRMTELGIDKQTDWVNFGQVMGMCDHLSCALGQKGYKVYKSIPYGPVYDTLPYLYRRAVENRSFTADSRVMHERAIYWRELKNRMKGGK
ncbi:PREDICTED: proline dehydrogenase 1, mitochondrial-like [Priapulus caudatus]|uniref:Proline dehydrogenase n=1 Tax=Priapulus caudatus TaxID=37621 RepID=A0ABM1EGA2_PRICU|nr:PREDICTED: proline dehydrogenase 1, mitochondrial-like [Priapulus caudatus]